MDTHGKCLFPKRIKIDSESKDAMRETIRKWVGERKKVRVYLSMETHVVGTEPGGWILFTPEDQAADIAMETWYKRRTPKQLATLKALEALLFYANHKVYPPSSELLYGYHQVILDMTGIMREDPTSGHVVRVTTSSPLCTTADMNRFIATAFQLILDADVPESWIEPATSLSAKGLYRQWYLRMWHTPDVLEGVKTWDDYLRLFPYDEFNVVARTEAGTGRTQKIHIISRGANTAAIDEPWNWIHGATSIHHRIHKEGWKNVLREYPHMVSKVNLAREMAKEKGLS